MHLGIRRPFRVIRREGMIVSPPLVLPLGPAWTAHGGGGPQLPLPTGGGGPQLPLLRRGSRWGQDGCKIGFEVAWIFQVAFEASWARFWKRFGLQNRLQKLS